jgi:hypothetical protein
MLQSKMENVPQSYEHSIYISSTSIKGKWIYYYKIWNLSKHKCKSRNKFDHKRESTTLINLLAKHKEYAFGICTHSNFYQIRRAYNIPPNKITRISVTFYLCL